VQALPSEQALLSLGVPMHAPVSSSQLSSVQVLPSSQPLVGPATHTPVLLQSPSVQAFRSEQGVLYGRLPMTHSLTLAKLQLSNWQSCERRPRSQVVVNGRQAPKPSH
jgi:hypothetical protein